MFIVLLALGMVPALAHETTTRGDIRISVGWGDEPAFTGAANRVEVDFTDAKGAPKGRIESASLRAEISFGSERMTLPLRPVAGAPGRFAAWLVPTRAGTYTFHITGTVDGQPIDVTSTCSETTFDCVRDVSDVQFPAKDPSAGQLAERLSRGIPRAEQAIATADGARTIGVAAIALATLALAVSVGLNLRRRR
jgi:hypothetical protein